MNQRREQLMALAKKAARTAVQAGAKDARVFLTRSRGVTVEWRDGKLDRISESTSQSLDIDLYVKGRYSSNATSDIREEAVDQYVRKMVDMTGYLAADVHRRLPDPSRYTGATSQNLEKWDPAVTKITADQRIADAKEMEEAARAGDRAGRIISVTSSVSDSEGIWVGFATNGFEAGEEGTSFSKWVSVSISDRDDRRPGGSDYGVTRYRADLPSGSALGTEALARAEAQIGSTQIPTGRYGVVIENRAAPTLAGYLLGPLAGGAIQQKRSFLEGKLGEQIGAEILTITSDPHLPRGLSSEVWDDEGMTTRKRTVIDRGVPKMFFLDTYYASKLGIEPTTGGFSNLVWQGGERGVSEMLRELGEGIWVTSFLGGNSNPTTGDFSLGIKGFYVSGGAVQHPISEMNIAGNHLAFWKNLAEVGGDPWSYSANRTPTLRFTDVLCSGSGA